MTSQMYFLVKAEGEIFLRVVGWQGIYYRCTECWPLEQKGWVKPHFSTVAVEFKAIAELPVIETMKNAFYCSFLVARVFLLVKKITTHLRLTL